MKKVLCLILAMLMLFLSGCELPFVFDNTIENEDINTIGYQLSKTINMDEYTPLDISEFIVYYNYTGSLKSLPEFDRELVLEDGTMIKLSSTTIGDLIDKGFSVIESEEPDYIWLSKDDKKLCVYRDDFEKDIESLEIESVCLKATDDYIGYEYHGVTKDATLKSIVEMWGQPSGEIEVCADEGLDGALVVFSYYALNCSPNVFFTYDKESQDFIYDELFITT